MEQDISEPTIARTRKRGMARWTFGSSSVALIVTGGVLTVAWDLLLLWGVAGLILW